MRAMVLRQIVPLGNSSEPLELQEVALPVPGPRELLIEVSACGICHTEIDEIEGRTPPPSLPIIPGHQVVGHVCGMGDHATRFRAGDRVGVAWIFSSCGRCAPCVDGKENLCREFRATGRDANGGYAEFMTVREEFAYAIPSVFTDGEAAPLLCAGAIGYRSLRLSGLLDGQTLGLTGFGASAHLVLKMVRHRFSRTRVFVFARSEAERAFALELGASWAGNSSERAPEPLHSIIDTTPVWQPIVQALENLEPGGRLIINAIRKEDADKQALLHIDYSGHLWMEKEIKSVANVTRSDVEEFLALAAEIPLKPEIQEFPLSEANRAIRELKSRVIRGAKVLRMS